MLSKQPLMIIKNAMIALTETAAAKVKQMLDKRGSGLGIQVGIRTTGCSGLAYTLEYVDTAPDPVEYVCHESHNVMVWTDTKSLVYLDGMVMDWVKKGLNEGFEFINPNESARCGCGESFSV
jgi:iron-sulfur cluster assembly protein